MTSSRCSVVSDYQESPYTVPLWNYVPKTTMGMVILGPNSIIVAYMDPLGDWDMEFWLKV